MTTMNADERADQLIMVATRLIGMIAVEIGAMKSGAPVDASLNSPEKERLVHFWRMEIQRIQKSPSLLAGLSSDKKQALKDASNDLQANLQAHSASLAAMKEISEGLVRAIAEEVSKAREAPAGYNRTGAASSRQAGAGSGIAINARA